MGHIYTFKHQVPEDLFRSLVCSKGQWHNLNLPENAGHQMERVFEDGQSKDS